MINERGFLFDGDLARAVIHVEHEIVSGIKRNALVNGAVLSSPMQLRRWLADAGHAVPNVRADTLASLVDCEDVSDDTRAVLWARLASTGITSKKLDAGLRRQNADGRIRDSLVYHAARTGRWSGRGLQPQNLPRGVQLTDEQLGQLVSVVHRHDLDALHVLAREHDVSATSLLATLVRACIVAPHGKVLVASDYAQIEARVLLWLAADDAGLEPFRRGIDPYKAEVAQLLGIQIDEVTASQRALGKVAVLGCGFQVGAKRFEPYAASMGVDWTRAPMTPQQVIDAWRDRHPAVAGHRTGALVHGHVARRGGLWRQLEVGLLRVVQTGAPATVGRCVWRLERGHLVCRLPSDRELTYRSPTVETGKFGRPQLTYMHGKQKVALYGGKIAENITQATARDILAGALVALERAGKRCVLHVHDEVVCECDSADDVSSISAICKQVPSWAFGLPIEVTAHAARRYRK